MLTRDGQHRREKVKGCRLGEDAKEYLEHEFLRLPSGFSLHGGGEQTKEDYYIVHPSSSDNLRLPIRSGSEGNFGPSDIYKYNRTKDWRWRIRWSWRVAHMDLFGFIWGNLPINPAEKRC
jgi:hypothetical protein